jgi:predicted alpha/beta-hydrolase family hydrolase
VPEKECAAHIGGLLCEGLRMTTSEVRGPIDVENGSVGTIWIDPGRALASLVVAPGAGAGMEHPLLAGFCHAIADAGVATMRFNFPYAERGRRSPDTERVLRNTWLAAYEAARAASDRPVLVGGKSLGGRIASMCVADGMPAAGLVFLGYPLHPPGRPERIRDEHLDRVEVPMLFLQGTADPFARPELVAKVVRRLGDRATLEKIEGGDHSFKVRARVADPREVGAGLAKLAALFVHRVASDAKRV